MEKFKEGDLITLELNQLSAEMLNECCERWPCKRPMTIYGNKIVYHGHTPSLDLIDPIKGDVCQTI